MDTKAIVLDFDGVIVESNDIKNNAFSEMFNGYPQYEQIMSYHRSHNHVCRQDKFRHILGTLLKQNFTEADITEMADRFSGLTRRQIIDCPAVEGAEDFLTHFSKQFPLYVASATPADELKAIVEARGLARHFKTLYGAPMDKAAMFQDILQNERISPKELLFIGDSKEDHDVAARLGLGFIGRKSGSHWDGLFLRLFNDLSEIKTFLIAEGTNNAAPGLAHREH